MYTWWALEDPRGWLWVQHNQGWLIWYSHLMTWQAWQSLGIFYEIWRQHPVFWWFTLKMTIFVLNCVHHSCSVVAEITLKQEWAGRANGGYIHFFTKTFHFQDFHHALDQFYSLFMWDVAFWFATVPNCKPVTTCLAHLFPVGECIKDFVQSIT